MITKFNDFLLILEKNERYSIDKIKKFCNVPEIYNWAIEFSPKFAIWFANVIKELIINEIDNIPNWIDKEKHRENVYQFFNDGKLNIDENDETSFKFDSLNIIKNLITKFTTNRQYLSYYTTISDWLKSPLRTENVNLSQLTFLDAYKQASEWHKNLEASGVISNEDGVIFMTFNDGYYWIDLQTNSDRDEARVMGHCGTSNSDTLLSLRNKQQPHVTVAYSYNGTIHQLKGKQNTKPLDKYYPYIVELLCYPDVSSNVKTYKSENEYKIKYFEYEYNPEEDFKMGDLTNEQLKYVWSKNPELFNNSFALKYFLYKQKLISNEQLMSNCLYQDLILKDGKIYFLLSEWSDLDCYKKYRDKRDNWQQEILSGIIDWSGYDQALNFDYNNYWSNLSKLAYEEIKNKVIGQTINVNDTEKEKEYDFIFDEKNTIVKEKDVIVKLKYKKTISLGDILAGYENDLEIESSDLDILRTDLNWGLTEAQEQADQNEAYNDVVKAIEKVIGNPVMVENHHPLWYKTGKKLTKWDNRNLKTIEYDQEGMLINIDLDLISDLEQSTNDGYSSVLDLINNVLPKYNDGKNCIDVDEPYYGWRGKIDVETLSDCIINRLYH